MFFDSAGSVKMDETASQSKNSKIAKKIHYILMCFKLYEMQYFALPLALYIINRRRCSILQDSVKIHETASTSEI